MSMAVVEQLNRLMAEVHQLQRAVSRGPVDGDAVVALRSLADQVDLAITGAVTTFSESTSFVDLGYANAGAWMAAHAHAWRSEPTARRRQAALLRELPRLACAVHDGRAGVAHLRLLAPVVTAERLPLARRDEEVLTDAAIVCTPAEFLVVVRRWAALCDDELHDPTDHEALEAKRSLRLFQLPDGSWRLDGRLEPLAGEEMAAALEAFGPKPTPDDTRTATQRRHDTMADLMHEALSSEDRKEVGGERPHVTVTLRPEDGQAVLGSGAVLPPYLRDTVLCDCISAAVWLSASGRPFDAGTPTSSIPVRNRRAVIARDRCCRYSHCNRPARWGDVHHLRHRTDGGTHELGNLVVLCRFHHRLVHRMGLQLQFDTDGLTLMIHWPGGVVLRSPPSAAFAPIFA